MSSLRSITMLVVTFASLAVTVRTRANLLVNGSFEVGPGVNGLSVEPIPAGSTNIQGWVVTRGSIDYEGTNGWIACDGTYSLDMNGLEAGAVAQTFQTVSGQVYGVNFCMAGNPSVSAVMPLRVQAAGQFADFAFDTTGHSRPSIGWVSYSWLFVAQDSQTTIEFISQFYPFSREGPALDDVVVEPLSTSCPDLQQLAALVQGLNLADRDRGRLLRKLQSAKSALNDFIDQVNNLRSQGKLDAASADSLIAVAQALLGN